MTRPGGGRQSSELAGISPHSVPYFHGKITRDQAEAALFAHKALEGLFLLRESVNQNYAISICHGGRVHHYSIEKQPDGTYQIRTGRKFPGPVELVKHHATQLDGFLTLARFPLDRPAGESPVVLQGVRAAELENRLRIKAMEMGLRGGSITEALAGPMRDHLRYLVLRDLHFLQPWYHDCIRRRESERRLEESGGGNGSFLVRYRKEDGSYVLSLMFENEPRHYKIEQHLNRLSIEGGQYFETLIEMIDHYHFRQDGLLCKLRKIVAAPDFIRTKRDSSSFSSESLEGSPNSFKKKEQAINNLRTASNSLPSLASFPINSNNAAGNGDNHNSGSPVTRKTSDGTVHTSNDLISFNDWPSVTSLLFNQPNNNITTAMNNLAGNRFVPNSTAIANFNANANNAGPLALRRISAGQVGKFGRSILPPLQMGSAGLGGTCGSDGFMHTPFTPVSSDATPTPRVDIISNAPTPPLTQARLRPPFSSSSSFSIGGPGSIANDVAQTRALQSSATCPLIPEVFRPTSISAANTTAAVGTAPNNALKQQSPILARATQQQQQQPNQIPCKFAPNNSLPPESLNFPPIIDVLWEEPDGSEERSSQPSSSLVSINLEALPPPPPHILNPLSQQPSPQQPQRSPSQSSSGSGSQKPCQHAPRVSTFCNSACCQQKQQQQQQLSIQPIRKTSDETVSEKPAERPTSLVSPPPPVIRSSVLPAIEEAQKIYDSLPANTLFLPPESIQLLDRLGGGNFGQVMKAIYKTPQGQEVEVAVKTLKESQIACTGEHTILSEAKTMTQLKHRHIVRLIGVCKAQHFMLVLELAPLGPINKYLKKHTDVPVWVLTELMHQVAQGMAYLESCKLVHRDLAARNVLLVTQRFAKISDFGMSKALNFGNDYYRAASAGKWPLKWYAPECIYYFRFDSKSDVWSFGITLWEVFSYGERPYKDMKGAQILAMLDQGLRLSRPAHCPEAIYAVMQQCWNSEGCRRPSFSELVVTMSHLAKGPLFPNNFSICHDKTAAAAATAATTVTPTVSGEPTAAAGAASTAGAFAFF